MLDELQRQTPEGRRHKLRHYSNVGLLCIDEVGYLSYNDKAADFTRCFRLRPNRSIFHITIASNLRLRSFEEILMRDNLDLSTPTGRLMFHMIAATAEFERELIRERVIAGIAPLYLIELA